VTSGSQMPTTMEQLLERQWEQGSQFLMEQGQHFDSTFICIRKLIHNFIFTSKVFYSN